MCVVEDEHQFVLNHRVMWTEEDVELVPGIIEETHERYPELEGCSFDKGFWSPRALASLERKLKTVALPKKGRLTKADRKRESGEALREARRKHPWSRRSTTWSTADWTG